MGRSDRAVAWRPSCWQAGPREPACTSGRRRVWVSASRAGRHQATRRAALTSALAAAPVSGSPTGTMATEIDRRPNATFQQLGTMPASGLVNDVRSAVTWAPGGSGDAKTFLDVAKMIVGATHPLLVYVDRRSSDEPELSIPAGTWDIEGTSATTLGYGDPSTNTIYLEDGAVLRNPGELFRSVRVVARSSSAVVEPGGWCRRRRRPDLVSPHRGHRSPLGRVHVFRHRSGPADLVGRIGLDRRDRGDGLIQGLAASLNAPRANASFSKRSAAAAVSSPGSPAPPPATSRVPTW